MKQDRLITAFAVFCLVIGMMSVLVGRVILGGIIILVGYGIFYTRGRGNFNQRSLYEKHVKSGVPIGDLYEKLKDMDTPLGKAWLAEYKTAGNSCIVFGPDIFRDCVIISKKGSDTEIRHTVKTENIIRREEDEYRFEGVISGSENDVSPERYAIFASFKMASVIMLGHLYDLIKDIAAGKEVRVPEILEKYKFCYHNSSYGSFRDSEGNEMMNVEYSLYPFRSAVLDHEGNELAAVIPHSISSKGEVKDSAGYELTANGEHFGEIKKFRDRKSEGFIAETEDGEFRVCLFPAVRRANISCNYRIEKDGRLMAVIGGSPNLIFEGLGTLRNDIVHSYDDDYVVLFAVLEIFILTLNSRFLK